MTQYKRIGIDTSKAVFTVHGVDQQDRLVLRINLRRSQLASFIKRLLPTEIAMEGCGSSHHCARELTVLGHEVRLIPPQYVKPYVKHGKNDRNNAEAICEAAGRPSMHFVPMKSVTQHAQGMVLKVPSVPCVDGPSDARGKARILMGRSIAIMCPALSTRQHVRWPRWVPRSSPKQQRGFESRGTERVLWIVGSTDRHLIQLFHPGIDPRSRRSPADADKSPRASS